MPTIEISQGSFLRLQAYATPLVDTAESALSKVLDLADGVSKKDGGSAPSSVPMQFPSAPDLSHTVLTSASINGRTLVPGQCNWNAFLLAVVEQAAPLLPPGVKIDEVIVVNNVPGQKEDSGYKFLQSVGLSIQGQNSNNAWKAIEHIAKVSGVRVEAHFYWSNHPKAAKPGQFGYLSV